MPRKKKHGYARYGDECNFLRAVQGAVADMRHEAGQIPEGGDGWESMNIEKPVEDWTLDELVAAYDYAIGQAETPALKAVRHYIDDMYRDDGYTVGKLLRQAKSMRARLRRGMKAAS